jgi:hypothetical protein
MDALMTLTVIVIALLVLGAAAAAFGADTREDMDDGRLPATRAQTSAN